MDNPVIADSPDAVGEFDAWLPSANLIWDVTDSVVFNMAYYETFEAFDLAEELQRKLALYADVDGYVGWQH